MEGFLRYQFGGLIFGRAYFRSFTVFCPVLSLFKWAMLLKLIHFPLATVSEQKVMINCFSF